MQFLALTTTRLEKICCDYTPRVRAKHRSSTLSWPAVVCASLMLAACGGSDGRTPSQDASTSAPSASDNVTPSTSTPPSANVPPSTNVTPSTDVMPSTNVSAPADVLLAMNVPPANAGVPALINAAPRISGVAPRSALLGKPYSFTVTATDPDGDTLRFSISGGPPWASLNAVTGRLSGTPTAVGKYENIVISVSDGKSTVSMAPFAIDVVAVATGSVTLSWLPPTRNADGTPLTDLAGYKVYWGTSLGEYPNSVTLKNPGLASYVVESLTPATWYFAITAFNRGGVESGPSNVASKTVSQ